MPSLQDLAHEAQKQSTMATSKRESQASLGRVVVKESFLEDMKPKPSRQEKGKLYSRKRGQNTCKIQKCKKRNDASLVMLGAIGNY